MRRIYHWNVEMYINLSVWIHQLYDNENIDLEAKCEYIEAARESASSSVKPNWNKAKRYCWYMASAQIKKLK
jgi:hypothetical protein